MTEKMSDIHIEITFVPITLNCSALKIPNGDTKGEKCGAESNWFVCMCPVCSKCLSKISLKVFDQPFSDFLSEFATANPHLFPSEHHAKEWVAERLNEVIE